MLVFLMGMSFKPIGIFLNHLFKRLWITTSITVSLFTQQSSHVFATTYLTIEDARSLIWEDSIMTRVPVILSKEQARSITQASKTRVRNKKMTVWKTIHGGWFILDQIIGKHENIDIAVGLDRDGRVQGIEILEYRETYGDDIRNPTWLAQFMGKTNETVLKLDRDIKNISGATLSCRHLTDGINRLTHTWDQVLRHL